MKRNGILLYIALLCGLTGGILLYFNHVVLPHAQKKTELEVRMELDEDAMPRTRVAVISDTGGIAKHTVLTDEIINLKIEIVDIPAKYAVKDAADDIENLKGKITKEDLRCGEQVACDSLSQDKAWFGDYQRLKEYSVANTVAGEVKTGNIIDIIVNYGNGDYDVVVPKIKIHKVIEGSTLNQNAASKGTAQKQVVLTTGQANKKGETILVLALDEDQYKNMEAARRLGSLETRLYLDESQPPSLQTFNYESALQKMKLNEVNIK